MSTEWIRKLPLGSKIAYIVGLAFTAIGFAYRKRRT